MVCGKVVIMRDETRVLTLSRAGVPSIYGSQCANEGSTGICVSAACTRDKKRY